MTFFKQFISDLFNKKSFIWDLATREFKSSYSGSILGIGWSIIEPIIYISIMYVFFKHAARYSPSGNVHYLPWLMTSLILWNFISGSISSSTNVFRNYSYLIKRGDFNPALLPIVPIISTFFIHIIFLILLIFILLLTNVEFSIHWLEFIYFIFCSTIFIISVSWITASINLFIKDIKNIVSVTLQIGFWVSPVFWDINSYPTEYKFIIKLNPIYYLLNGYRNSFLYKTPFWSDIELTIYFWIVTISLGLIGSYVYKKLRPSFGDVL